MNKQRVFIDMDGVLADYNINASITDMQKEGYFANLSPRNTMIEALNYVYQANIAELFILSAVIPSVSSQSINEKNAWLDKYLPIIDKDHRIFTLCGENKASSIKDFSSKDILCDDYSENLRQWLNSGGKGIKIINEINGNNNSFQDGPRLLINDKQDLFNTLLSLM